MSLRDRDRPPRSVSLWALSLVVLSLFAQVLTPTVQAWHLACDDDCCVMALAPGEAAPMPAMASLPGPAVPAHHHDESTCTICQTLTAASRLALDAPPLSLLAILPTCDASVPEAAPEIALCVADLAVRTSRGPPAA